MDLNKKNIESLFQKDIKPIAYAEYKNQLIIFPGSLKGESIIGEYYIFKNDRLSKWYPESIIDFQSSINGKVKKW